MGSPADLYRQRAVESLAMAEGLADPQQCKLMHELGLCWVRLSEHAEEHWRHHPNNAKNR
jgi:hypothetical protein